MDQQVGSELPATLDRECHGYTPRLHLEGVGDVTRLKTIYAFGEVGGGFERANYKLENIFQLKHLSAHSIFSFDSRFFYFIFDDLAVVIYDTLAHSAILFKSDHRMRADWFTHEKRT